MKKRQFPDWCFFIIGITRDEPPLCGKMKNPRKWEDLSPYVIDSFPIAACDNYRILRSKRYRGEVWRGRQASKKRYFYGLKLHLMVTEYGQPVEFFMIPGSYSDTTAMKWYLFDLPEGSWVTGDKAYTDYTVEDVFQEAQRCLLPLRKANSKRPVKP